MEMSMARVSDERSRLWHSDGVLERQGAPERDLRYTMDGV